eukprot:6189796-Pleurochrysis_carterae.AAC.1
MSLPTGPLGIEGKFLEIVGVNVIGNAWSLLTAAAVSITHTDYVELRHSANTADMMAVKLRRQEQPAKSPARRIRLYKLDICLRIRTQEFSTYTLAPLVPAKWRESRLYSRNVKSLAARQA